LAFFAIELGLVVRIRNASNNCNIIGGTVAATIRTIVSAAVTAITVVAKGRMHMFGTVAVGIKWHCSNLSASLHCQESY
jgi:hypothetical protein